MRGSSIRLCEGDHVVHFYDAEQELVGVVGSYLAASLSGGDVAVVIATSAHAAAFREAIGAAGLDAFSLECEGRLVLVDADEALSRFVVGGVPDAALFDASIGSVIEHAVAAGRPVRAYGEMVARLWSAGNTAGAVALERLWNELAGRHPFALFCAYPRRLMVDGHPQEFADVCGLHSKVIAGAPIPSAAEASRRFVAVPASTRLARNYVATMLREWGLGSVHDDAVTVLAELAANAVRHGEGDFTVSVGRLDDGVRLMVGDTSSAPPEMRRSVTSSTNGRGLMMLAAIADRWGYYFADTGKVVWAELKAAPREDGP